MSILLTYQGLPPGCGFVELVRSRPWSNGHWVALMPSLLRSGTSFRGGTVMPAPGVAWPHQDDPDPDAEVIWDWCGQAVGRFPGLAQCQADLGKSYQFLPFLTSAKVRHEQRWPQPGPLDPRSWNDPARECDGVMDHAFWGAPEIAKGVVAVQGVPVRLIERATVQDIALCLAAISLDELAPLISELVLLGVRSADDVHLIRVDFAAFQGFFLEAAEGEADVMVVYD